MKKIRTNETLIKAIKENNATIEINYENFLGEHPNNIYNEKGEIIGTFEFCACRRLIGRENIHKLYRKENLTLKLEDLIGYWKDEERKTQRKEKQKQNEAKREALERTQFIKEAIKYFNSWQEGDNITITADFVNFAEELKEVLKLL